MKTEFALHVVVTGALTTSEREAIINALKSSARQIFNDIKDVRPQVDITIMAEDP